MFWNDECKKLSDKLWIPKNLIHQSFERKNFKCDNKNITFNYYTNNDKFVPNIQFQNIPIYNNQMEKEKLFVSLHKKEITRMDKEISNPNCKLSHENLKEKHFNFVDKIEQKCSNLDGFIRAYKIQIFPTKSQKKTIFKWFDDTTFIYNKLVTQFMHIYNKYDTILSKKGLEGYDTKKQLVSMIKDNKEFPINFKTLRSLKISDYCENSSTPYCIIADTIKEFVSNVKSNLTKLLKGQITEFKFKHRKFNRKNRSITIESHYTTEKGFYPSIIGEMKTNDSIFQWQNIQHDYKLIYDKYDKKFYVHVPKYVFPIKIANRNIISISDPGERCFQSVYGLDHVILIGENMRDVISRRLLKIDNLKAKLNKPKKEKYNKKLEKKTRVRKHKYKRAIDKHHKKLEHLQQELHHKTAIYMCENYDRVMVTDFSSKKVSSKDGDLDAMTKRVLGKLSHYRFRQRLQQKCEKYGCQYLEVNEAWTSKTCCGCGNINHELGSNKVYECENCKITIPRDINGAINIFIKNKHLVLE